MHLNITIVESPLAAPTAAGFQDNFRYLLWCLRAEALADNSPIASHVAALYLDDTSKDEREIGYGNRWFFYVHEATHVFYRDRGWSNGMQRRKGLLDQELTAQRGRPRYVEKYLPASMFAAFNRGEWPPHTPGCEFLQVSE